ncbi:hypothetical protein [Lysinibacillus sp. NPDC056232]|uniref:hypothetical protein n=1 Tax=Lysinibacillus sp. NPDC056232 TaxID=3345756 RepID=UPI0035E1816A
MIYKTVAKELEIDHSIRRGVSGKRLLSTTSEELLFFIICLLNNNTWKSFGVTNSFKGMLCECNQAGAIKIFTKPSLLVVIIFSIQCCFSTLYLKDFDMDRWKAYTENGLTCQPKTVTKQMTRCFYSTIGPYCIVEQHQISRLKFRKDNEILYLK